MTKRPMEAALQNIMKNAFSTRPSAVVIGDVARNLKESGDWHKTQDIIHRTRYLDDQLAGCPLVIIAKL